MDVSAVKAKNIADASSGGKSSKSTAEQLMGDFSAAVAERMKLSGQNVAERGQTGLVGALTAKSDVQPEPKADHQPIEAAPRDDHQPRERAEAPEQRVDDRAAPVEAKDNAPRDNAQQDTARNDTNDTSRKDDAPNQEQAQSNGRESQSSDDGEQAAQSTDGADTTDTAQASETVTEQAAAGQGQEMLASVVDVAQKSTVTTTDTNAKQNAAANVEAVKTNVANQQANVTANDGGDDLGDLDLAGQNAGKKNAANASQQQTQTAANLKTDGNHTLNQDATVKQQQAANIAAKVDPNQKLDISVSVNKQSEQLVSQPTANLGAQAAMADDGDGLMQTATQTVAKGPAQGQQAVNTHNLGNQAGQQGQEGQQQAQQNMQAALAEAAKNNAATDSKAQSAQAATNNAASGVAKVGGGEGMSNAQGLTQSNTTQPQQQAAATQKAPTNPQAQHRGAVTEQVNVQITKAIANGMDKINIQLKPAHLGRVDIQMELASDGRVTAVVTADNKDTLDLLKQDSRELERAMREAGLQLNSNDLSFNLRENGGQGDGQEMADGNTGSGPLTNEPTLDELLEANTQRPDIISEDRVDITA